MTRPTLVLFASLFFAGCEDDTAKPAAAPTAPLAAPLAAQAFAATSAAPTGGSTICRVYVTERNVAKAALDAAPSDTLAQSRVKTLDALVKETCN